MLKVHKVTALCVPSPVRGGQRASSTAQSVHLEQGKMYTVEAAQNTPEKFTRDELRWLMDQAMDTFLKSNRRVVRISALGRRWRVTSAAFRIFAEEIGGEVRVSRYD